VSAFYRAAWVAPFIREHFVPVAIDAYTPGDPAEAEFFKKVNHGVNYFNYVTAAGTVLGRDGCDDMKSHLKEAVEKFKALPEGERKPEIGKTESAAKARPYRTPPPGALVARVYCAYLDRDEAGGWSRAKRMYQNTHDGQPTNPVEPSLTWVDMMWLTAEEVKALSPEGKAKGERVAVPPSVRRRLFRYYACDLFRRPVDNVREGELALAVDDVAPGSVRLRLEGWAKTGAAFDASNSLQGYRRGTVGGPKNAETSTLHGAEFRFLGFLNYDLAKKAFDRFDAVGLGEAWGWFTEGYRGGPHEPRRPLPVGVAFELVAGDRPADQVTPFGALPYAFGNSYFKEE